jgi:hypothetical protein
MTVILNCVGYRLLFGQLHICISEVLWQLFITNKILHEVLSGTYKSTFLLHKFVVLPIPLLILFSFLLVRKFLGSWVPQTQGMYCGV